ncbi:MAG: hypothetical protein LBK72_04490, partial [Bifidobacteriaceae bacterium]|nr:hypothetical protein [Bifidobacteriaceae bacterium]
MNTLNRRPTSNAVSATPGACREARRPPWRAARHHPIRSAGAGLAALALATAGLVVAMPPAHAQEIALDGPAVFACDQLFGATANGSVYAVAYDPSGATDTTLTRVYGTTAHPITSMAVGPSPVSRGGDGKLHAYHWGYNNSNAAGISVLDVTNGASIGTTFTVPRA